MKRTLKVVLVLLALLMAAGFAQGALTGACGPSGAVDGNKISPC